MKRLLSGIACLLMSASCMALDWDSLWWNQNQRGFSLLQQQQYEQAADTFSNPTWKAAAAYKAGDYAQAAELYEKIGQLESYNLGNALAQQGQYEAAIKAYDQMLRLQPYHADAQFNKKLVEELLKQQQEQQQNQQDQNQQKQDQQKQDQQKQDQQKQDQQKQDQQKQDQQKQDQQKQDQQKQDQQKQDQQKQDQQKQDQQKQDQPDENQSLSDKEKQAAKEQWLQLIPDDPGGLMRQKFLRDYLKRHRHSPLEAYP